MVEEDDFENGVPSSKSAPIILLTTGSARRQVRASASRALIDLWSSVIDLAISELTLSIIRSPPNLAYGFIHLSTNLLIPP
mmetsp:Transcript_25137/g.54191  ORF Transcript_25137/g.54191 Transcript_25137/m.54191 type:complete len:81 (-) Transcript_25137:417-659(-)